MFQNVVPSLFLKTGSKKYLPWFSYYLLELIEKDTLYYRIVKGKINTGDRG
jgi:hypothetical protein